MCSEGHFLSGGVELLCHLHFHNQSYASSSEDMFRRILPSCLFLSGQELHLVLQLIRCVQNKGCLQIFCLFHRPLSRLMLQNWAVGSQTMPSDLKDHALSLI